MSTFSDFYDALRVKIPTITNFSTKTEIPFPYELESNIEGLVRNGWGVTIGASAVDTSGEFNRTTNIQSFGVVLSREVLTTDSQINPIINQVKLLQDDNTALRQALDGTNVLLDSDRLVYETTTEIEPTTVGKKNFISITVFFTARITDILGA